MRIQIANLKRIEKEIKKRNKRNSKKNVPLIKYSLGNPYVVNFTDNVGVEVVDIEFVQSIIKIDGWELLGRVDFIKTKFGVSNFIFNVPNKEIPKKYYTVGNVCDHCGTKRYRNSVFIIEKDDKTMCVGSNCLVDFLGIDCDQWIVSINNIKFIAENYDDYDLERDTIMSPAYDLLYILQIASFFVLQDGYTSKQKEDITSGNISTTSKVKYILFNKEEFVPIDDNVKSCAKKVFKWMKKIQPVNSYMNNLLTISIAEYVSTKTMGTAVSAVNAYMRFSSDAMVNSEWQGNINDKIERNIIIKLIKNYNSPYGDGRMLKMTDGDNSYIWFTSACIDITINKKYAIRATVKAHSLDAYSNNTKITMLKNVKFKHEAAQ